MSDRFPFPIPDGWFGIAWSDDLPAGRLRSIRCFGSDWILLRTSAGEPALHTPVDDPHRQLRGSFTAPRVGDAQGVRPIAADRKWAAQLHSAAPR